MDERSGTDEAQGRWTQIDVGMITFDLGTPMEDWLSVFLWRRVPTPVPPQVTEADYTLQVVIDYQSEQFTFEPDEAEQLAEQLPDLLRQAAARARAG